MAMLSAIITSVIITKLSIYTYVEFLFFVILLP